MWRAIYFLFVGVNNGDGNRDDPKGDQKRINYAAYRAMK